MKLQQDLREFIELLNSHGCDYLIVGGHAVAYHGHPRFTADIDFLLRPSAENAERATLKRLRTIGGAPCPSTTRQRVPYRYELLAFQRRGSRDRKPQAACGRGRVRGRERPAAGAVTESVTVTVSGLQPGP